MTFNLSAKFDKMFSHLLMILIEDLLKLLVPFSVSLTVPIVVKRGN
jgi:hypothetical protein